MAISGLSAIGASATQTISHPSPPAAAGATTPTASFTDTIGHVINQAVDTLQAGEAAAIQGVQGDLPPFKVVEGIMGAQRVLQQALAIRDKAVSAYQEISRMAI
jgi:flagellar hook-basal body complex protein FliE